MMQFLVYEAKAAVILAVFYMFYRLLLSKETFHRFNRVVLLVTATGSLLLPLWQLTFHEVVEVNPLPALPMAMGTALPMALEAEASAPWWPYALVTLFIIGALAVLGQTLYSLSRVLRIIASGEKKNLPGNAVLVITETPVTPFSWMRYVVMSRDDYAESDHATILCHEQAHIRLRHSWDLLLVDVVSALQWFNPAIWMLRSDLRAVHEYEADAQVLYEGFNVKQYQYLLVKKAVGTSGYSIANSFNHRELKSRITMMYRKKSSRSRVLRVLYFVPLVGACLFANARTEVSYVEKISSPSDKVTDISSILQGLGEISSPIDTLKIQSAKVTVVVRDTLAQIPSDVNTTDNDSGKVKIRIERHGNVEVVNPLVVVDGKRVENINDVDPNTIKSFQVLKDEDAVRLYGEAGENGVIIMVTKDRPKDQLRYTVDDVEVTKEVFDKAFAAGYAEVGRKTNPETGIATAYILTKEGGKAKEPTTKEHWVDADGNDVLFGGDKYAWKQAKASVLEDLKTGEMTVRRIKGFEVDGKILSDAELQAFTTDETLAYHFDEESGILIVMTAPYFKKMAEQRRANSK